MRRLTLEQKEQMLNLYNEGLYFGEISKILNIAASTVKYYFKNINLKTHYKFNTLNDKYFNAIEDSIKAYVLGFIYADGNIHISKNDYVFSIGLKMEDEYMVNIIKNQLQYTGPLYYTKNNAVYLKISNKYLTEALINLGVIPRKSFTLKPPDLSIIKEKLIPHFIRGYMDGDGCIGKQSLWILGTEEICNWIKNYSDKLNIKSYIHKNRNIFRFTVNGRLQLRTFLDSIYLDSEIHLIRKYNKYLQLIKYINSRIKSCKIENCTDKHKAFGFCSKHYLQNKAVSRSTK